ncbi:mechanosensitive ion channel family protein [Herminiimonas sp. NPDC097707]|uniref:mechanosensitive ion channel family protein n=1 Tax=Herminiimonas sp. NPDC097707 TaxID=3364007 RepID=UPI00383A1B2B
MNQNPLTTLWVDFQTDLGIPDLRWQILAVVLCFALGWLLTRVVGGVLAARDAQKNIAAKPDAEQFARVLWPLLTLVLLGVANLVLAHWLSVDLMRVVLPLLASFVLVRLALYILRRVFARDGNDGSFILLFGRAFAGLVWTIVALHITGLLPDIAEFLDSTLIPLGRNKVSLLTMLQAILSVGVTLLLALWISALLEERLMKFGSMHSSMRAVLSRMSRAILVLIALLVSLSMVGIDLTVLSVFGGALGVGLGLGLQKLASSYVSGFVILLERSLSIGDTVTVDRFTGQVIQINTRYTVLRGGDGTDTVMPNEMLVSNVVQNVSLTDRLLLLTTKVTVDYRTDIDLALRLLEEAALNIARVRKGPDRTPKANMTAFGADGIDLQLGFWIADPENGRVGVLSDVNRAIWRSFQVHDINVPFPQREIRLIDEQYRAVKEHLNADARRSTPDSAP